MQATTTLKSLPLLVALLAAACGKSSSQTKDTEQHPPEATADDKHGDKHGDKHAKHGDKHAKHGDKHAKHGHDGPLGHRFERADEWVKKFDDPGRDAWQKPADVLALMDIKPGMTVADIGAGTGYFLPHLASAVGESGAVLGLDVEKDMVRYMNERATREKLTTVTAKLVPFDDPSLDAASVDRVLIVNTWHHIPNREAYAAKLAAGLKPGGAVYLVDFTMETEMGPPKSHRIEPDAVARELAAGGLATDIRTDVLPEQYIVIARRK